MNVYFCIMMCRFIFVSLSLAFLHSACTPSGKKDGDKTGSMNEEQQLKAAINQYPDSLLLVETLIQYYRDNGQPARAMSQTDSILHTDSLLANFWNIRAVLLFEQADTTGAIHSLEKAVSIEPYPGYWEALGTLYSETGNPAGLSLADSLLIHESPKWDKEAYFIKGLYYSAVNNGSKAIEWFDKSLSISFTYMEAYREKAIALMHMNRYAEALAVLDKAITIQNGFDEGHYYRGQCLEKLKRPDEAMEAYQTALMYDAGYAEARSALDKLKANGSK